MDCNPGISELLAVFTDTESRDWWHLKTGSSGLQKVIKIVLFYVSNDRNKNFSYLVNKIFYKHQSNTSGCVL